MISRVISQNRNLELMLASPIVPHHKKLSVLSEVFRSRVGDITFSIIEIITRKNREELLPGIARAFQEQFDQLQGVQVAQVTTTQPLDEHQRNAFREKVSQLSGKQVELVEKIDAKLIGGYVLQIGDQQIDESLRHQLQRLQRQFTQKV